MALHFEPVTVGPFQENTWLIGPEGAGPCIVVDPGAFDATETERLVQAMERRHWTPAAIVNTHGHIDHIAGIPALQQRYDLPLYIHPGEKMWIEHVAEQCALFGLPPLPEPRVDRWLEDGEQLCFGPIAFEVRHVPGHTPGGCAFVFDGHVVTGDTLFAGSIGRTDFPGGSFPQLERSIREKLYTLPDETQVHSGHGPDTTIGRERRHNPFVRA
ncbi:MAG: MBL fold metallo-hydrolase [Deltaproteobacteria bacterium]|nr:MAG: MBL fold metallo-hydrolase [Deltaproteobacteria bacterium]